MKSTGNRIRKHFDWSNRPRGAESLHTFPLCLVMPDSAPESKEAEISFRGFSFLIGGKLMKLLTVLILLLKGKVRYVLKLCLHF